MKRIKLASLRRREPRTRAVDELSDRERRELISLLEAEMKRSGA